MKPGKHVCTIKEISWEHSKNHEEAPWKDVNKQLKVVLRGKNGVITAFMNTIAFQNSKDHNEIPPKDCFFGQFGDDETKYVINKKSRERVVSPERSAEMQKNIGNLCFAAGVTKPVDEKSIINALTDANVGVWVREKQLGGKTTAEAYYFVPAEEISEGAEIDA